MSIVISGSAFAQQFNDYLEVSREVLKVEKKALIAEVMELSDTESEPFWLIYNEYEQKKYEVNTKYFKIVMDFSDNYGKMSAEKATELTKASLDIQMLLLKLRKSYAKKFAKVISPQKTLRYLQAENKIRVMIDAEMALQIPLLETIED